MPTPIPSAAGPFALRSLAVGRPVSQSHGLAWCESLAFLTASVLPPVLAQSLSNSTADGAILRGLYRRSPGCRVLGVYCTAPASYGGSYTVTGAYFKINGTIPTPIYAAGPSETAVSGGVYTAWFGDGTSTFRLPVTTTRNAATWLALYDVSALSTSSTHTLSVQANWADGTSITVVEMPPDVLVPESGDAGSDATACLVPARIVEGSAVSGRGFASIYDALEKARTKVRRHLQWGAPTTGQQVATNSGTYVLMCGPFWTRARRLRVGGSNTCDFYIYYHADAGVTGVSFALYADGVSIGTLTGGASVGGTQLGPVSVSLPTSGTGQETKLEVYAKVTAGTGAVRLEHFALIEAET